MPSKSSGRITKPRRAKNAPTHQKNHRWESFTAKVAKLHSLDPLRKVRRHDLESEDLSLTTSYFRNGLEKWTDLNLSKTFVSFRREVLPLSESLAQLLHFEDRIVNLLETYIDKQEKEALEPLLDLLTALAHDLGVRFFEKHYSRALDLIVALASGAGRQDVEVTEWTFAALAFLFKYLSRLLVPDLRPTYRALAPLLGKTRHPPNIARFASEALSFLIKKAAAPSHREAALVPFVEYVRDDLISVVGTKQFELYNDGVMTMFAEAMKSAGQTIHSTAPDTYITLLNSIPAKESELGADTTWTDVCCGVLTSVIHHSNAQSFQPVAERILEHLPEYAGANDQVTNLQRASLSARLIGITAGVRKGSRITDWSLLVQTLDRLVRGASESQEPSAMALSPSFWRNVGINIAVVWSLAPMDVLIPSLSAVTDALSKEPLTRYYVPFCAYFAELHPERFRSLFQAPFQRFLLPHWSDGANEDLLCILLPILTESAGLAQASGKELLSLPQSWQDHIIASFEQLEVTPFPERAAHNKDAEKWRDSCLPKYSAMLRILDVTSVQTSTCVRIADVLLRKLKLALRPSASVETDEARFIVEEGFSTYLRLSKVAGTTDETLEPLLNAALPRFRHLPGFLAALLAYKEHLSSYKPTERAIAVEPMALDNVEQDPFVPALISNLFMSSHDVRLLSLQLLDLLGSADDEHSALAIMLQIERTPLEAQNTRAIAVQLRKLGQVYGHLAEGSWLQRAVPHFLFGMMTVRLSPVWDDAVEALKQVSQSKMGEEMVAQLAFAWLEVPSVGKTEARPLPIGARPSMTATDFSCTALSKMKSLADDATEAVQDPHGALLRKFEQAQDAVPLLPAAARQKALKVMSALPGVAEKRSRKLVPYLLSWTGSGSTSDGSVDETEDDTIDQSWSMPDRKLLLGVFALFVNPKVLYQSEHVYDALLQLVGNGDVQIQKLALKAILAWKQEGIKPYQENLEYLLDDARLKNEITVLFQGDNPVQPEHRSEAMPVLLRLLYGRSIAKKQAGIRLSIMRNLPVEDLGDFLAIALGELSEIRVIDNSGLCERVVEREVVPPRKQVGTMNMVDSIINELGSAVLPYMDSLVHAVLYCLFHTSRRLRDSSGDKDDTEGTIQTSLYKDARAMALKCLYKLFQNAQSFDWTPYQNPIVSEVISPRIERLAAETTQGVSSTWKLLETWSALPKTTLMFSQDPRIIPGILGCLSQEKTKPEVKVFALGIVKNLVKLAQASASDSEFNELIRAELLEPNIEPLLTHIDSLLRGQVNQGRELLEAAVDTVVEIAPFVQSGAHAKSLVEIATFLLHQPAKNVSPRAKGAILHILEHFIALDELKANVELRRQIRVILSSLFSFFKDRQNRENVAKVFRIFAADDPPLQEVASICVEVNSFAVDKIETPNYDLRLSAFRSISRPRDDPFSMEQWLPLLHNLVFYMQKDEEFGILSSNSADGICRFIEAAENAWTTPDRPAFEEALTSIVLPTLYAGAREPSETVRRETLRAFGHLVSHMRSWPAVADLSSFSPADDSDSDKLFFFNILSPALSRQLQAVQLLIAANERAPLSGKNISHFFLPLLEHFIFGHKDSADDHGLGAQSVQAIAGLAVSLEWSQYRAILRRYVSYIESKPELSKQVIRLLENFVDALGKAATWKAEQDSDSAIDPEALSKRSRLGATLPDTSKLTDDVTISILPVLFNHLHEKDESLVSARVPVGIIIVKLLKLLPQEIMAEKLPGALTDLTNVLRSKAWDSREMARDTLAKIATILEPDSFGFILKELRGALTRGHQLHVLSYTLHSLLIPVIRQSEHGKLDYCAQSIVAVIMDDIFGVTGLEKDAEEYISKMKEVKSSKSQDSMELLARSVSITRLVDLVQPLQALLMEKLDVRTLRKIDELLGRITTGLLQNPAAESRGALVFCYQVIQEAYKSEKPEAKPKLDPKLKRYLVQKGAARGVERGTTTRRTDKLVRFAIDVMRSLLRKHDSLRNATNLAGFLPVLGDAVVAGEDEVRVASFKLLAVIVKVPFPDSSDADNLFRVATKEAVKAISSSSSTTSDLAQTALKLVSVVLRDRRQTPVKEPAIDALLNKVKDDLTEPLYRHVTFNFLRAVLDRKMETAVVYDVLDYVGTVMITNDDKDTRDLARGAFFQFLRDYPQKKSRWAKQLAFVVANLKYDREGGRLSVMEVIHLLLLKSANDFVQEVAATCFLPLVFVLANDESESCYLAAAELIREIFQKADKERLQKCKTLMRSWLEQDGNVAVQRLALQTFALYFESRETMSSADTNDVTLSFGKATDVLCREDVQDADSDLIKTAQGLVRVMTVKNPSYLSAGNLSELWAGICNCLLHSDASVKLSSLRLLSTLLADFVPPDGEVVPGHDLVGSHGQKLEQSDVSRFFKSAIGLLLRSDADEVLAGETASALTFLGICVSGQSPQEAGSSGEVEEESDQSESEVEEEAKEDAGDAGSTLSFLLRKLSAVVRKETPPKAFALVPKLAALDVLDALCRKPAKELLLPVAPTILRPLRNITDPSIPAPFSVDEAFKTRHEAVKTKAQAIMDTLQRRLGTAEYTTALLAVSGDARERRLQRSSKRKISAVMHPERHGREKMKRLEKKKERRLAKGREHRGRRQGF